MRILGVDPGSRLTGYGCIEGVGNRFLHIGHGTLRLSSASGKSVASLEDRLLLLYQGLSEVIVRWKPQVVVVEQVFFAKNALSALKLGQVRGAVLLTARIHSLMVAEYSPTEVKSAVVGHGHADKEQVAKMLSLMFGAQTFETADASDGLALAVCHAQKIRNCVVNGTANEATLQSFANARNKKKLTLAESLGVGAEVRRPVARPFTPKYNKKV
ncbi:MAG: crossover junction endodeoxyribonuclease RuvC [Bdellovibrionia bacterium]